MLVDVDDLSWFIFGALLLGVRATGFEYLGLAGSGCYTTMGSFRMIRKCFVYMIM